MKKGAQKWRKGGDMTTAAPWDFLRNGESLMSVKSFRWLRRKAVYSMRVPITIEIVHTPTLDAFGRLLDTTWSPLFSSFLWIACSSNWHLTWFEAHNSTIVFDQYISFDLSGWYEVEREPVNCGRFGSRGMHILGSHTGKHFVKGIAQLVPNDLETVGSNLFWLVNENSINMTIFLLAHFSSNLLLDTCVRR